MFFSRELSDRFLLFCHRKIPSSSLRLQMISASYLPIHFQSFGFQFSIFPSISYEYILQPCVQSIRHVQLRRSKVSHRPTSHRFRRSGRMVRCMRHRRGSVVCLMRSILCLIITPNHNHVRFLSDIARTRKIDLRREKKNTSTNLCFSRIGRQMRLLAIRGFG